MQKKKRILFFCKHNSCRSQMAEAYLRNMAGDRFDVVSAGLYPAMIHPMTEQVLQEDGIQIKGQTSKSIDLYLGKKVFDWIIIVCRQGEAECPQLVPLAMNTERWSLPDPVEVTGSKEDVLIAFRQTRDGIKNRVQDWLARNNLFS